MGVLNSLKLRVAAVMAAVAVLAMSLPAFASATVDYSKLTEGVTGEFETILPIILTAIGLLLGITFALKWAVRKFGGMH